MRGRPKEIIDEPKPTKFNTENSIYEVFIKQS